MNQNIEEKYFLTTPSNSLKIVKQQKNLKTGSLKKEKIESFIYNPDLSAWIEEKKLEYLKML